MEGNNKDQTYYYWITNARGIGAILVILGHSFGSRQGWMFNLIYSFHMPLFFFLSGFCFRNKGDFWHLIRSKSTRLLIPYYWSLLTIEIIKPLICTMHVNDAGLIMREMLLFDGNGWFLRVLFKVFIVAYLFIEITEMIKAINNRFLYLFVGFVTISALLVFEYLVDCSFFETNKIIENLVYFLMGYFVNEMHCEMTATFLKSKKMVVILLIISGVFLLALNFLKIGQRYTPTRHLSNCMVALFGIVFVVCVANLVTKNSILSFWGDNSLASLTIPGLFVFDLMQFCASYLQETQINNYYTEVILRFAIQVIFVLLLAKGISYSRFLSKVYGCKYIRE